MKRYVMVLIPVAAAIWAGCDIRSPSTDAPATAPREDAPGSVATRVAAPAPAGEATYVSGGEGTFSLSAYRGQVVLVDIGATWSEPCRRAVPDLNRLCEELRPRGLALVGLAVDRGSAEEVRAAVQSLGAIYPVAAGPVESLGTGDRIRALPTRLLLDRKGVVRKQLPGAVPVSELKADVLTLLNET